MLKEIHLENFKAFEEVTINLGLITVLIGPNGTGKSSVLQALMLLKQSLGRGELAYRSPLVDLVSYEDTVHTGRESEGFKISFARLTPPLPKSFYPEGLRGVKDLRHLAEYGLEADAQGFDHWLRLLVNGEQLLTASAQRVSPHEFSAPGGLAFTIKHKPVIGEPLVLGGWRGPRDAPAEAYRSEVEQALLVVAELLRYTRYVPSIRGVLQGTYSLGDRSNPDAPASDSYQMVTNLAYASSEIRAKVSEGVKAVTGRGVDYSFIPDRQIAPEATGGPKRTRLVNEGFGTNQLTWANLVLADSSTASFAIEEPEIHLHPASQAKLADLFVKVAKEEQKQIMMTTHSEHILMRLLTRVADGTLQPEELAVYYFEKDERGVASAKGLGVNDKGQLEGGLRGFFEADLDEMKSYMEALMGRAKE